MQANLLLQRQINSGACNAPLQRLMILAFALCLGLTACTGHPLSSSYRLRCWERDILNGQNKMLEENYKAACAEFKKALPYADTLAQKNQTREILAKAYIQSSNCKAALALLVQVRDSLVPTNPWARAQILSAIAYCQNELDQKAAASLSYEESAKLLREYINENKEDSENLKYKLLLIDTNKNYALNLKEQNRIQEAEECMQRAETIQAAIQAHPEVDKLLWCLNKSKLVKTPDEVIALLEPIVKVEAVRNNTAEFKGSMMQLACAYANKGDDAKAEQIMDEVIAVMRTDPFVLNNDLFRFHYYFAKGCQRYRPELSIRMSERALKYAETAKPTQLADLYFEMGMAYHNLNQRDKAREFLLKAGKYAQSDSKPDRRERIDKFINDKRYF